MLCEENEEKERQNLCIKRIVVEQVDAMKLLAVCLGHSDNVLISSEYFNLELATSNIR